MILKTKLLNYFLIKFSIIKCNKISAIVNAKRNFK